MLVSGGINATGVIDGSDGYNTYVVHLYRKSATALGNNDKPGISLWYKFSTQKLYTDADCTTEFTTSTTGGNGWGLDIPAAETGKKIYVTCATAYAQGDVDKIEVSTSPAVNEWSTPVIYTENGSTAATVVIYKRYASQPTDKPSDGAVYTFATNGLVAASGGTLNGWSTEFPAANGQPCWRRQATALSNGATDTIDASEWSDTAVKEVEDGTSVTKTAPDSYRYAVSASGTTTPSTWYDTKQAAIDAYTHSTGGTWPKNTFMWTETTIHWNTGNTVLYSSERNPDDGQPGQDIVVDEQEIKYSKQSSGSLDPSTLTYGSYPSTLSAGDWLYIRTTIYYKKADSAAHSHDAGSSVSYTVQYQAENGTPGRSVSSITEHYKASTLDGSDAQHSETAPSGTAQDPEWGTNPVPSNYDATNKYLWNYEKIVFTESDGTQTVQRTTPSIITTFGKNIDSIVNYYKASTKDGTTAANSETRPQTDPSGGSASEGWTVAVQTPMENNPFLWNYEKINYINTDGTTSSSYTDPHIICHFGKDGKNAVRLALDNKHEDFLYNDAGSLIAPKYIENGTTYNGARSKIRLYDGQTEKTYGTDFTAVIDTTQSTGVSTSSSAANYAFISAAGVLTVRGISTDTAVVVVKTTYNGSEYCDQFTANKTKQDKYDLVVDPSSIAYNSATYTEKTIRIYANRTDLQGNISRADIKYQGETTGLKLFARYVRTSGGSATTEQVTSYNQSSNVFTIAVTPSIASWNDDIYLELRLYTAADTYKVVDHETVVIAKAENGNNGTNGNDGQGEETVYIRTNTDVAPYSYEDSDPYGGNDSQNHSRTDDGYLPVVLVDSGDIEENGINNRQYWAGGGNPFGECTNDPKGVSEEWPYEWELKHTKGSPAAGTGVRTWNTYAGTMTLHNRLAPAAEEYRLELSVANARYTVDYAGNRTFTPVNYQLRLLKVTGKETEELSSVPSNMSVYRYRYDANGSLIGVSGTKISIGSRAAATDAVGNNVVAAEVRYVLFDAPTNNTIIGGDPPTQVSRASVIIQKEIQRMLVPAGIYTNKLYTRTDTTTPLVLLEDSTSQYNNTYWFLDADSNNTGTAASPVYAAPGDGSGVWKQANEFDVVLTKMLFAPFANLGSFIVYERYFFSQYGTLIDSFGNETPVDASNVNTSYNGITPIVLNGNNSHDGIIVCKVQFTVTGSTSIKITLRPSSEVNYDFGAVGTLDSTALEGASAESIEDGSTSVLMKSSGTTVVSNTVNVSAGNHFFEIAYAKDSSQSSGNDNATFLFENTGNGNVTWNAMTRIVGITAMTADGGIKDSVPYGWLDYNDPMAATIPTAGYKFRPMKCINALTGEEWMAGGKVYVSEDGDVTMRDIMANNGTFDGIIRAKSMETTFVDLTDKYTKDGNTYKAIDGGSAQGATPGEYILGQDVYQRVGNNYVKVDIAGVYNFVVGNTHFILPSDSAYISQRVLLYNGNYDTQGGTCKGVMLQSFKYDSGGFTTGRYLRGLGLNISHSAETGSAVPVWSFTPVQTIFFVNGTVEVVAVPDTEDGELCEWAVVNLGTNCFLLD